MRALFLVSVAILGLGCGSASAAGDRHAALRTAAPRGARAIAAPRELDRGGPPRLDLSCDNPSRCPASVGMVVFPGEPELERCTGTLVAEDRVLTASHCVGQASRTGGAGCEGAWIAFPATSAHPAEWVACREVLFASPIEETTVLRADYALLALATPVRRPVASTLDAPVEPGSIVTIASVTPHRIYATQHALEVRLCRVTTSDDAEAALGASARAVGWLSDCPILPGNSGSPVLDYQGRVRALVHGGSHPFFAIGVTSALPSDLAHTNL